MAEKQASMENLPAALVDIQRLEEPQFDIEREIPRLQEAMRKTGEIAKKKMLREAELIQKQLDRLYEPVRGQRIELIKYEEAVNGFAEYINARPDISTLDIDEHARGLVGDERPFLSPRLGASVSAFAPYPNRYRDPDVYGIGAIEDHLDPSIGQIGWFLDTQFTGPAALWTASGVGAWLYSGEISGLATVEADVRVSGNCIEYCPLGGYAQNIARIHIGIYINDTLVDSQQTIHDRNLFVGFSVRNFEGERYVPRVLARIEPARWYLIWVWEDQYGVSFPPAVAATGQNFFMRVLRIQVYTE